jgi:PleD family two-component response regulator
MERLNYTKIYMYSTTSDGSAVAESKDLGAEDFIVKPAKTVDLKDKLARILDVVSNIDPANKN